MPIIFSLKCTKKLYVHGTRITIVETRKKWMSKYLNSNFGKYPRIYSDLFFPLEKDLANIISGIKGTMDVT
jgi:hypothetical protein